MSDDEIIIEPEPEPAEESAHQAWFDDAPREQQTRYLCLDMARMCGALPEKVVPIAAEMEEFINGKRLKAVE